MKFHHDDDAERVMPERVPAKYETVHWTDCDVRWTRVHQAVEHYRTTLPQAGVVLDDERYFALGMTAEDLECEHLVEESPDRFGHARCSRCEGHLWSACWVADGLFGDYTPTWATNRARGFAERLPSLVALVTGGVHTTERSLHLAVIDELAGDVNNRLLARLEPDTRAKLSVPPMPPEDGSGCCWNCQPDAIERDCLVHTGYAPA